MREFNVKGGPAWPPSHPGSLLAEVLLASGLTVKDAAGKLGISRQTLHSILAGTGTVTPAMAVRLGKLCGNGPGLWLRMQQARDLWLAEREMAQVVRNIPTLRAA